MKIIAEMDSKTQLLRFFFIVIWLYGMTVTTELTAVKATCDVISPFMCENGTGCIEREVICNGVSDCSDGSDEVVYNQTIHANLTGKRCSQLQNRELHYCYLPQRYICDHEVDCLFGEDECDCNHGFRCVGTEPFPVCRVRAEFCDNVVDCFFDGSDELKYAPGVSGFQCSVTKTRQTNYCMLPTVHVCDGISDCNDGTDECFCNNGAYDDTDYLNDRCFRCLDGTLVVSAKRLCDGVFHCKDLSDECLCSKQRPNICEQVCKVGHDCGNCSTGQVMCSTNSSQAGGTICIDRSKVCDQNFDCPNREDEVDCAVDQDQIFNCADGSKYIPKYMHCDNYTDCADGSDEVNCSAFFRCREPQQSWSKPGAWENLKPAYATSCDAVAECNKVDDECNATLCGEKSLQPFCNYLKRSKGFICPNSEVNMVGKDICDGYPTCNNSEPHLSADEYNCTNRFYCTDHGRSQLPIHIPLSARCNGITDCFDVSDEIGCNESTHYYCNSGNPLYIPMSKVCNGIQECHNGEDECQNCSTSPFSSDKFLISSYVLQVLVWITGLMAVSGNIAVLIHSGIQVKRNLKDGSSVSLVNRILVINLALADLLLGIYLFSLGIMNSVYENIYCRKDVEWRGSSACVVLGCLAMISIQTSVFILTIMTSYRYYVVTRPFQAKLKPWSVIAVLLLAWTFSLILACVPLAPSREEFFVSGVWYRNDLFLANPTRGDLESFVTRLQTYENLETKNFSTAISGPLTWRNMIATVSKLRKTLVPEFSFGYYSAHGVCLPRLFPNPVHDKSWGYSLFIIILNFVCFVYVAILYIAIYRQTKHCAKKSGRTTDRVGQSLQRKIARIVISNFLCWFPVCIIAFVSVAGTALPAAAYAVSAIVLLPINSAANPFLYSNLPDLIWQKIKPLRDSVNSLMGTKSEDQTTGTTLNDTEMKQATNSNNNHISTDAAIF